MLYITGLCYFVLTVKNIPMPAGPDCYDSMTQLYDEEVEGLNYQRQWYRHRWRYHPGKPNKPENKIFIMAPHGGSIEAGTTELALATAGFTKGFNGKPATNNTFDYFLFEGINPPNQNGRLHVTASNYNDPVALQLVGNSLVSLAFHGCTDEQANKALGIQPANQPLTACLIGGMNLAFKEILETQLQAAGFNAVQTNFNMLDGNLPENIINRNSNPEGGAQFELTTSFRKLLYTSFSRKGRRKSTTTGFWNFVDATRNAIALYQSTLV